MFNKIILVGRLTKDPELRYTPNGKAVTNFRLAVDRGGPGAGGEKETDFIDVVVWEKQAETVSQYLSKGRLTLVDGRLQMRQFDAQDGTKRTVYEVVATTVRFLPDGGRGNTPGGPGAASGPGAVSGPGAGAAPAPRSGPSAGNAGSFGSDFDPSEDDVPF